MKNKLIFLIVCTIIQMSVHVGFAQRDPSKEILVFFNEGVQREARYENGVETMRSFVKSERLKSALTRLGIDERALEVASPTFREADTLTIMPDGTRLTQANMTKLFRIRVSEGKSREELIEELNRLPEVLYAEANGTTMSLIVPNESFSGRYSEQWALQRIQSEAAWDIYTGSPNSIIAIIDGGVDVGHEDLSAKISGGVVGWGWDGHGIHVAGIAAASTNNSRGIAGVDWMLIYILDGLIIQTMLALIML
jgi:subtilisin family serine protease